MKLLSETSVVIPTLARASKELASKELDGVMSKDVSVRFFRCVKKLAR